MTVEGSPFLSGSRSLAHGVRGESPNGEHEVAGGLFNDENGQVGQRQPNHGEHCQVHTLEQNTNMRVWADAEESPPARAVSNGAQDHERPWNDVCIRIIGNATKSPEKTENADDKSCRRSDHPVLADNGLCVH